MGGSSSALLLLRKIDCHLFQSPFQYSFGDGRHHPVVILPLSIKRADNGIIIAIWLCFFQKFFKKSLILW